MKQTEIKFVAQRFNAVLPLPPTSNQRLAIVNGRLIKAAKNRNYQKDIAKIGTGCKPFKKAVAMEIVFFRQRLAGDIDGRLKTLFDSLSGILYDDDRQIDEIHVYNRKDKDDPRVELICYEI